MNKDEIKYVMAIIRPAVWALYGRQKLELNGYSEVQTRYYGDFVSAEGILDVSGWFEVSIDNCSYKLEIKEDIVISLGVGELNV